MPPPPKRKRPHPESKERQEEQEDASLRPGSIQYIRMQNFMSFSDVELRPGPGFNMVVGPNGSGKSTLVCAVTLGLGGDTGILRRQASPQDFVTRGSSEAKVTIRLKGREGEDDVCVVCTVAKSLSYSLNGRKTSKKQVRLLTG